MTDNTVQAEKQLVVFDLSREAYGVDIGAVPTLKNCTLRLAHCRIAELARAIRISSVGWLGDAH